MQDLFLGGLDSGEADHVALPVEGVSFFVGSAMALFIDIVFIRFTGVPDNIAVINNAFGVAAHKLLFDLDAFL